MGKRYVVNLQFVNGVVNFHNVTESERKNFTEWIANDTEENIMEFDYKDYTYYLNRKFFCAGSIKEED